MATSLLNGGPATEVVEPGDIIVIAARVDNDAETAAFADIFRMDTELNVVANATPQDVAVAKLTELMGESLDTIYAAAQAA